MEVLGPLPVLHPPIARLDPVGCCNNFPALHSSHEGLATLILFCFGYFCAHFPGDFWNRCVWTMEQSCPGLCSPSNSFSQTPADPLQNWHPPGHLLRKSPPHSPPLFPSSFSFHQATAPPGFFFVLCHRHPWASYLALWGPL